MSIKQQKNNIVGVKELRENLDKYIARVNKGETLTVFRRSEPVFKISPVDEWGDTGMWETVADFTDHKKGGISAKELLKHLKNNG